MSRAVAVPDVELVAAVERATGRTAVEWRRPHTGLSAAHRFVVTFSDGASAFVKAAVDDETEQWLRTDHAAMSAAGRLAPDVLVWTEVRGRPVIVMESLHDAHWPAGVFAVPGTPAQPVVWREGQVEALFGALETLAGVAPPPTLAPLQSTYEAHWPGLVGDPIHVVGLGLADDGWWEAAMPELLVAEAALELGGSSFVHNDVRSDNVCFRGDRVVLVDWSDARVGTAGFDLANLLQTLPLEGGPDPQDVLPDAAPFAAWRAGELVRRAAGHFGPAPPWLVKVMKRLALIDLHWAASALGLPRSPLRDWRSI